jgi:uncharacterized protein YjbI with pentapeptide repeats
MEEKSGEPKTTEEVHTCQYKYKSDTNLKIQCPHEPLPDRNMCIFHEKIEEKDNEKCMRLFYDLLYAGKTNFEGFQLKELNPPMVYFTEDMNFSYVRISEKTDFCETTFRRDVDFRYATFSGPVDFSESKFQGRGKFSNSKFRDDVNFITTQFLAYTNFNGSSFSKNVVFFDSRFIESVDFIEAKFLGDIDFKGSIFSRDVDFRRSIFKKNASFINVKFNENCNFNGVKFKNRADFEETIFQRRSSFHGRETEIHYGNFLNAELSHVSFIDVDLTNTNMYGASLEETYLSDAIWSTDRWSNYVIREELEANKATLRCKCGVIHIGSGDKCEYCNQKVTEKWKGKPESLKRAESTYRNIKLSLRNDGDYRKAGKFYYKEMTMRRRQYTRDKKYHYLLGNSFMWLSSGYGERWYQVLLLWILAIVLFGAIFQVTESLERDDDPVKWYENYYFSGVTFTTLGFGDISPRESHQLGQGLAMIEALLGTIFMGLFLFTLARQIMR